MAVSPELSPSSPHVVIVGGGAAGLMAANFAAGAGVVVTLLERMPRPGRKILISGGGRCNILPSRVEPEQYFTSRFHTFRKVFLTWPLPEQIRFFEDQVGIPLALEVESGKIFPRSNRASDVMEGLLHRAVSRGAHLRTRASMEGLEPLAGGRWRIHLREGAPVDGDVVIMATGGLSVPATGSDGTGLRLMKEQGHELVEPFPALTPLLGDDPDHHHLAGLSLDVSLMAPRGSSIKRGSQSRGGFLFTHQGYSGPVVLDMSHHVVQAPSRVEQPLWVQWTTLDATAWEARLKAGGSQQLRTILRGELPQRLVDLLLGRLGLHDSTVANLRREQRQALIEALTRYELPWSGHEGYKKAEVTGGGVSLTEVDTTTLESRRCPGIFLCGEMLDVFGPIGGYNFLWAWVSGRWAGLAARRRLLEGSPGEGEGGGIHVEGNPS